MTSLELELALKDLIAKEKERFEYVGMHRRSFFQTNLWHFKSQADVDKINAELWADLPPKEPQK